MKRVLVLGWYGHGNIGDEAFKASFPLLWPQCKFSFADGVPPDVALRYDAVMVGGGSFLDAEMDGLDDVSLPMAFVGVGVGKAISGQMHRALDRAQVIVVRDRLSLAGLPPALRARAMLAADLVFARPEFPAWTGQASGTVTVLLSEHFAPRGPHAPEWVASSWTWFCRELAQMLEGIDLPGKRVQFLPMSTTRAWDDRRAAAHVISRMVRAAEVVWYDRPQISESELLQAIAGSRVVVSQRLHGSIFAKAIGVPVVAVVGHDKVLGLCEEAQLSGAVGYYALSAATLSDAFFAALREGGEPAEARSLYLAEARERWRVASGVVAAKLSL